MSESLPQQIARSGCGGHQKRNTLFKPTSNLHLHSQRCRPHFGIPNKGGLKALQRRPRCTVIHGRREARLGQTLVSTIARIAAMSVTVRKARSVS